MTGGRDMFPGLDRYFVRDFVILLCVGEVVKQRASTRTVIYMRLPT